MKTNVKTIIIIVALVGLILTALLGHFLNWWIFFSYLIVVGVSVGIYAIVVFYKDQKTPEVKDTKLDEAMCLKLLDLELKDEHYMDMVRDISEQTTIMAGASDSEKTPIRVIRCNGVIEKDTNYVFLVDIKNHIGKKCLLINPSEQKISDTLNSLAETPMKLDEIEENLGTDAFGRPVIKRIKRSETKQEREKRKEEEVEEETEGD